MRLKPTPNWKSERTELFLLEPDLVTDSYVSWLNDPKVNQFLESRFRTHSLESTREFVQACLDKPDTLFLGIRSTALGGRHVGNIKLDEIDHQHGRGEIGIMIGDVDAWGKGIASSSIRQLCAIGRDELKLRKITAGCYGKNIGSSKAFVKAGFEIEGTRRDHYVVNGELEDLVLMGWLAR